MKNANNKSHEGNLNPMFGKRHNQETKNKISNSQKVRYAAIRKALQIEEDKFSLGRTDKKAKEDLLHQAIYTDTIGFRDIQQARNFAAIMAESKDSYIKKIIKEELAKLLNDRDGHA